MADLTRPQPATIDDLFGIDLALRVLTSQLPSGRWITQLAGEIVRAMDTRRLCKGIGRSRRIKITILIIPQRGMVMSGIDKRMPRGKFRRADEFPLQPHIAP